MKRIVLCAVTIIATVCQAQERFKSDHWHFSFDVPHGWELNDDEFDLAARAAKGDLRFEDEVIAICLGPERGGRRSSMVVQVRQIGDDRRGLGLEDMLRDRLTSNFYRPTSLAYVNDFEKDLVDRGLAESKPESKFIIFYNKERNVYFETVIVPLKAGGTSGISTARVLGNNRVVTLNFEFQEGDIEGPCSIVEEAVNSLEFEKHYGFGEVTPTSIFRTAWFWIFPGFGTLIVAFLVFKWAASEHG